MNYIELLENSYNKYNSLVCLGLDPVIEDIPEKGGVEDRIYRFYEKILNSIMQKKEFPSAVKPNYAFYAQYGFDGLKALKRVIDLFKDEGFPVILDVKRGDIGKTAEAYAKESFDFFNADAVTISPFLGHDSISPFIKCYPGRGYYILTKTSNRSSYEIQDLKVDKSPLYIHIAEKIIEWHRQGVGSVVGATYPGQFSEITEVFIKSEKQVPLLIPGVGAQGGDLYLIVEILNRFKEIGIHRINSSSAINYAYKRFIDLPYQDAAVKAIKELNDSINKIILH